MHNEPALYVIMEAWIEWSKPSDSSDDYGHSFPHKRLTTREKACEELPRLELACDGLVPAKSE